jgi:hypothetical protein
MKVLLCNERKWKLLMMDRLLRIYSNRTPRTRRYSITNCDATVNFFYPPPLPSLLLSSSYYLACDRRAIETRKLSFAPILTIYTEKCKVRIFDTKIGHLKTKMSHLLWTNIAAKGLIIWNRFFKGSLKGSFAFSQEFLLPNGRLRAFPPLDLQAGALSYHPTLAHSIFEISWWGFLSCCFIFIYSLHFVFLLSLILDEQKTPI